MIIDIALAIGYTGIGLYCLHQITGRTTKSYSDQTLTVGRTKFDFRNNFHMLVCGASGSGKTVFVEQLLSQFKGEIYLCNTFEEDFLKTPYKARINDLEGIKELLKSLVRVRHREMVIVVIDELLELSIVDKSFAKFLTSILATARHMNINIIAISQIGVVEVLGHTKQLFNNRVVLSLNDTSAIRTVINNIENVSILRPREYYYLTRGEVGKAKVPVVV